MTYVLELTVDNPAELFDGSAPSCLGPPVLRPEIAEYVLEQIAAVSRKTPVKLILYLPVDEVARTNHIPAATRTYFDNRRAEEQRHLRRAFGKVVSLRGSV